MMRAVGPTRREVRKMENSAGTVAGAMLTSIFFFAFFMIVVCCIGDSLQNYTDHQRIEGEEFTKLSQLEKELGDLRAKKQFVESPEGRKLLGQINGYIGPGERSLKPRGQGVSSSGVLDGIPGEPVWKFPSADYDSGPNLASPPKMKNIEYRRGGA